MYYLGIDVGGSRIKTGVVNDAGEIVWRSTMEIPETFAAFRQAIIDLYNEQKDAYDIRGVGISSCGGINPYTGDVTPCIAPKLQYLIGENYYELRKDIPVPIAVEKDGNCAALGEKWEKIWKWQIISLGSLAGSLVLLLIIPVLGALVALAASIVMIVVAIMELVALYQSAQAFQKKIS